jgi:hypothetical protein
MVQKNDSPGSKVENGDDRDPVEDHEDDEPRSPHRDSVRRHRYQIAQSRASKGMMACALAPG